MPLVFIWSSAFAQAPQTPKFLTMERLFISPTIRSNNQFGIHQNQLKTFHHRNKLSLDGIKKDFSHINYDFPSLKQAEGVEQFYKAFGVIENMLEGRSEPSLKDAVFITENAYLNNSIKRGWYEEKIKSSVSFINEALKDKGYNINDDIAKK